MQPDSKIGRRAKREEEILLLCYYVPSGISTVPENVAFLQLLSEYSVTVFNLYDHRQSLNGLELPDSLNFTKFSAIILHNTVSYSVDNLRSLDRKTNAKLRDYEGVKVLMKQDENHDFKQIADYIEETRFDLICTCLPESEWYKVYPASKVGDARFLRMLTGYVTPTLRGLDFETDRRPVDVGYRGSIQPLSFGRLAYEKRKIGVDMARRLADKGLRLDVSNRWEDRIGGDLWHRFLGNCKATLGAESGASVFDLRGDLDERCRAAETRLGPYNDSEDYAEQFLHFVSDLEGNVDYAQVSPRHFEACATRTLQLLYPGRYSDIFVPYKHYVPLERDYSNLEEVIEYLQDDRLRAEVTSRAKDEVVGNAQHWVETFVLELDNQIGSLLSAKGPRQKSCRRLCSTEASNVLLVCAHPPEIDPRLGWIADYCPTPLLIHALGVLPPGNLTDMRGASRHGGGIYALPRRTYIPGEWSQWYRLLAGDSHGVAAISEILLFERMLALGPEDLAETIGAPLRHQRLIDFRWYLQYFLDICATLLYTATNWRGVNAVIATDLDALIPSIIISRINHIPLIYDAHELWSESDVRALQFEKPFWTALEGRLLASTQARYTVSPGLAIHQERLHGYKFEVLPNCEPLQQNPDFHGTKPAENQKCRFLFQGAFAEGRGLKELVSVWAQTNDDAVLLLRGKSNPFREEVIAQAKATGLYNVRIFFPDAVEEKQLLHAAASSADVGVVPYPRTNVLYENCSPNKLSQYMAVGLPILANDTNFVSDIVNRGSCGMVVNFSNTPALVAAVNALTQDRCIRKQYARNAVEYFSQSFHWQSCAKEFYNNLTELAATTPSFLTEAVRSSEPYYFRQSAAVSVVSDVAPVQWVLAECRAQKSIINKTKALLRPLWKRLPEKAKTKLRIICSRSA
jgi:glycosyltransferase involved in cell wall biosynthesis